MKVGIVTMHRIKNYGSFLQGYALKRLVESYNHECQFFDFKNGEPKHIEEVSKSVDYAAKLKKIPWIIKRRIYNKKFGNLFEKEYWPMLGINDEMKYDLECDLMIIGSDEVFNYAQNYGVGYVPCLFGHGIKAEKIITYAASAGHADVNDVKKDNMEEEIKSGFSKIADFSVRDENTCKMVEKYSDKTPVFSLDPTLVYSFENEIPDRICKEDYILIYAYGGRMDNKEEIDLIKKFAAKKKLKLVSPAGMYQPWCDYKPFVSPFEMLSLFKHASYVITDTFHGSVFSIKFGKQFVSFVRGNEFYISNSNKVGFLLKQFGLENRVCDIKTFENVIDIPIDYTSVGQIMSDGVANSRRYLDKWFKKNDGKDFANSIKCDNKYGV